MTYRRPLAEAVLAFLWWPTAFLTLGAALLAQYEAHEAPLVAFLGALFVGLSAILTMRTSLTIEGKDLQVCNGLGTKRMTASQIVGIDIGLMASGLFPKGIEVVTWDRQLPVPLRACDRFSERRAQVVVAALVEFGQRNGVEVCLD